MHAKFDTIHGAGEWGVDGWGNERNHKGGVLPGEKDDPLYPHREFSTVKPSEMITSRSKVPGVDLLAIRRACDDQMRFCRF